jgi:integrase
VNLFSKSIRYRFTLRDGEHLVGQSIIIPPRALLVAHGKDKTTRVIPLNNFAYRIMEVLCNDVTTGDWLFTNREGEPMISFKKDFAAACSRAGIDDLRHTTSGIPSQRVYRSVMSTPTPSLSS